MILHNTVQYTTQLQLQLQSKVQTSTENKLGNTRLLAITPSLSLRWILGKTERCHNPTPPVLQCKLNPRPVATKHTPSHIRPKSQNLPSPSPPSPQLGACEREFHLCLKCSSYTVRLRSKLDPCHLKPLGVHL